MDCSSMHALHLEESGSCESGWTMYIASSVYDDHEDTEGCSTFCDGTDHQINKYNDGEDSDDSSMASDASSGPCYREQSNDENAEARYLVDYLNIDNISSRKIPKIMDKKKGKEGILNADLGKEAPSRAAVQRNEAESNHRRGHVGDTILCL